MVFWGPLPAITLTIRLRNWSSTGMGFPAPKCRLALTVKYTGQESGGKLRKLFKFWSFLRSKFVTNVYKLFRLLGDFLPRLHSGVLHLKTTGGVPSPRPPGPSPPNDNSWRHRCLAHTIFFWHQQWLGAMPPSVWNCAENEPPPSKNTDFDRFPLPHVSIVKDSENSSITTTGFPTSHRWSAYITSKCPKGWHKKQFLNKIQFQSNKVCTKFLCVKTSSGNAVV